MAKPRWYPQSNKDAHRGIGGHVTQSKQSAKLIGAALALTVFGAGWAVGALSSVGNSKETCGEQEERATSRSALTEDSNTRDSGRSAPSARNPVDARDGELSTSGVLSPIRATVGQDSTPGSRHDADAEVLSLKTRAVELDRQLANCRTAVRFGEGEPVQAPTDLPSSFSADALRRAATAVLRKLSPPGDVTSIDCLEYPCIVYGKFPAGAADGFQEEFPKAVSPEAAEGFLYRWSSGGDEVAFAAAVVPSADADLRRKELQARIRFRVREMLDATPTR